ncbi:collectin-11-like [Pecten maximus]|uniref:collectin-11-like n=1 Tax=Pecten maximus TaxID=6579 RepID=UPI001458D514|nr:collectin-11-like [Pecten maximus]
MTCDLGTLKWNSATVVCLDLSPYVALGYTEVCTTESVLKFVGNKVKFDVAKGSCEGDGGHLARPRTTVRWNCLKEYCFVKSREVHVWMDITDRIEEGVLLFTDNSPVPLPHYWQPGEPLASTKDSVDCVAVWSDAKQWDDLPCGNVAHYMCEIEL